MGRRKKQDEEPDQDYMDGTEPPEHLGADVEPDETIRAQEAAIDQGEVLIVLGNNSNVYGKDPHITAKFACPNRPDVTSTLGIIGNNYVGIREPVRGVARKPLVKIHGRITKMMPVFGIKSRTTVWIEFPNTKTNQDALAQIGECEPPTAVLYSTGEELPAVNSNSVD